MSKLFSNVIFITAVVGIAALGALMIRSAAPNKTEHSTTNNVHYYIGIDSSKSDRASLGAFVTLTSLLSEKMQADKDSLTIFFLNNRLREFYDQKASGDRVSLQKIITQEAQKELVHDPLDKYTYPSKFWSELERRASDEKDDAVIILFSDGDNDDLRAASKARIKSAAIKLSKNPHIKSVIICGAEPRNWAYLRDCFYSFQNRFHLLSTSEMNIDSLLKITF